jgi:DNA mismatch endonuclease, patch repair protein
MLANRSTDTELEIRVRSALHRAGLRYKKNVRAVPSIPCKADLVFSRSRVVVFIDGCFWHGCADHSRRPSERAHNRTWWLEKLRHNVERDRKNDELLSLAGWRVLHVWEHEAIPDAVAKVQRFLKAWPPEP